MSEDRQHDMEVDIKEMLQELAQLRTALIGIDGTNGLRSKVEKLKKEVDDIVVSMRNYGFKEREETCIGAKLVAELRQELKDKESEEKADMKLDKETMVALEKIALDAKNSRRTNIITIVGLVLVFVSNMAPYLFG